MSVAEQSRPAAADVEGRLRRRFVAPPLDGHEVRRLVLICGCIAAAAAANFAGSALPQRTPVAVGAALLGALLVLRRRQVDPVQESDPTAVEVAGVERGSGGRRGDRAAQAAALDVWLSDIRGQLEAHEQRLTSLSGRQTLIDLRLREQLADLLLRIEELDVDRRRAVESCDRMRTEHRASLQRLEAVFVEHHQAITQLVATYSGTERNRV